MELLRVDKTGRKLAPALSLSNGTDRLSVFPDPRKEVPGVLRVRKIEKRLSPALGFLKGP